jgi:Zn-dependent protease
MHGYAAYRCGDDTAYLAGRLTFNPLAHIDIIGTVIVPFLCYSVGAPVFGWAKPVPVNYYRLQNPKNDMAKVSFAGPASNIFLFLAGALCWKLLLGFGFNSDVINMFFIYLISVNLILTIFNLLPVPPLDGSKVLAAALPADLSVKYMRLERYNMIIVIILLMSNVFSVVVGPIYHFGLKLILGFVGAY